VFLQENIDILQDYQRSLYNQLFFVDPQWILPMFHLTILIDMTQDLFNVYYQQNQRLQILMVHLVFLSLLFLYVKNFHYTGIYRMKMSYKEHNPCLKKQILNINTNVIFKITHKYLFYGVEKMKFSISFLYKNILLTVE